MNAPNLAIGYQKPVAQNIQLTIEPGEFIGIFGANGAGKTTFLRTLLGLLKPLLGKIHVLGAMPKRGHLEIGYMPSNS